MSFSHASITGEPTPPKLNFLYKYFIRKKILVLSNIILTNRCLSKCRTTSFILPRIHIVFHAHCHVLCNWNKFIWNGTLLAIEIKQEFDYSKKKYQKYIYVCPSISVLLSWYNSEEIFVLLSWIVDILVQNVNKHQRNCIEPF